MVIEEYDIQEDINCGTCYDF